MDDFKKLLKKSLDSRNAILFTGSGFSIGMRNIKLENQSQSKEPNLKDAKGLAEQICNLGKFPVSENLRYAADRFLKENPTNAHELIELLEKEFTITKVRKEHEEIVEASWTRFYTTNYDKGLEKACENIGKTISTVDLKNNTNEYVNKNLICVHINGSLNNLNIENLQDVIKLSSSSYLSAENFRKSIWYRVFKDDLEKSKIIVFVGYSMYDIEIEEVLFENSVFREKTFFIVGENFNDIELEFKLNKYGTIIKENYDFLAKIISSIPTNTPLDNHIYSSFYEPDLIYPEDDFISDEEIRNFLIFGKSNPLYYQKNLIKEEFNSYSLIYRSYIDLIIKGINDEKDVLLLSYLGNGKSVLCDILSYKLQQIGFRVFKYNDFLENYKSDIDEIMKQNSDTVIIIDNFLDNQDIVKYIDLVRNKKARILITSRTSEYNRALSINQDINYLRKCDRVDLNQLDSNEILQLIKIFDNLGIWKDKGINNIRQQQEYLLKLKNQISLILLELLKSTNITEKLKPVIHNVIRNKYKNAAFALSFLSTLNIKTSFANVNDISGDDLIYSSDLDFDKDFTTLFNKDANGYYSAKSSLFSTWLIKENFDAKYIIETLLKIAETFYELKQLNRGQYETIFLATLRFSFVERLIPDSNKTRNLVTYYDKLKKIDNLTWLTKDPHFWMQYAMAMMTMDDLEIAQGHLDNAYKYAKLKGTSYDTSSIDSQQARLYIKKSLTLNNSVLALELFENAHKLLMNNTNNHYKFRQVIEYKTFFDKKYYELNTKNKTKFMTLTKNMLNDIQNNTLDQNKDFTYSEVVISLGKIIPL